MTAVIHRYDLEGFLRDVHHLSSQVLLRDPDAVALWNRAVRSNDFGIIGVAARRGQIGAGDGRNTAAWYALTYARLHAEPMARVFETHQELLDRSGEPLSIVDLGSGPGTCAGAIAHAMPIGALRQRDVTYTGVDHNTHQRQLAREVVHTALPDWAFEESDSTEDLCWRRGELMVVTSHIWNQAALRSSSVAQWSADLARLARGRNAWLVCTEPAAYWGLLPLFVTHLAARGLHAAEIATGTATHQYRFGNLSRNTATWRLGPTKQVAHVIYRLEKKP